MSDFLLQLGQNPSARKLIQGLGLPLPLPTTLRRARGPWEERPLADRTVAVATTGKSPLAAALAVALARAGADPLVAGEDAMPLFLDPGTAWGRPARPLNATSLPEGKRLDALVFDASAIEEPAGLHALYDFFHPLVARLSPSGRALVLGRSPAHAATPAQAAAQEALSGFVRSLGREVGRRGATANGVHVEPGAEGRIEPVVRFLLSPRAAFVSGQVIPVSAAVRAVAAAPPVVRPLEGKVALVTGAARGIGEATARRLAAEGARVVCLDRPADDGPLSQVARDIAGETLLCDVTDGDAPARIAAEIKSRHGGVDVVVHNAGVTRDKTLARMKPEAWDQAVDINLGAVVRITAALVDGNLLRDQGRVVCLSSVAGIAGNMGQTNYAASKAGVIGFVAALAPRLAARGIAVNAVAPGFIETRLTAAIPTLIREVGRRLSDLGQGGLPVDVAELITFLASPGAGALSGATVRVCGGAYVGK
jgi:3-oxoacyl-[acyl-carrier protein] reductase